MKHFDVINKNSQYCQFSYRERTGEHARRTNLLHLEVDALFI